MTKKPSVEFTSRMSRGETTAALIYIPIHTALLPVLMVIVLLKTDMDMAAANFLIYVIGVLYMLLLERRFLRREFDSLCDSALDCLVQVLICYGIMLGLNLCVSGLLSLLGQADNPNNTAITDLAGMKMGTTTAMAVFLAPIVEELMFRGGVFGLLRRYNRIAAYAGSILLFSVYHIWSYAVSDPYNWIFIIQYFPASYVLCRCYEKTNSIWPSIFLHMLTNGVSLKALDMMGAIG